MTGSPARSSQPAESSAPSGSESPSHKGMLRHGWIGVAQMVGVAAIAVAALVAIYTERSTLLEGIAALRHVRVGWLVAGFSAELVSMVGLAQLERCLLRGVGATHTLRSVLATAYSSNAISVSVPIIGSSIATAYAYRDFRRAGARAEHVSVALTVAGVFSTVAFAVVAATGALITGNPTAAALSLVGSFLLVSAVAATVVAFRFPRARTWLVDRAVAALRMSKHVIRRPKGEPRSVVTGTLDRVGALRVGYWTATGAFGWALLNWVADVACLVCAIKAVGEPVPWTAILIIWTAGVSAASFSPVPAGLGIVDIVLITALATAGLHGKNAVAAALVYRSISLKALITLAWLIYHHMVGRHRGYAPGSAPSSPRSTAPLRHASAGRLGSCHHPHGEHGKELVPRDRLIEGAEPRIRQILGRIQHLERSSAEDGAYHRRHSLVGDREGERLRRDRRRPRPDEKAAQPTAGGREGDAFVE
ncbi:MAG TPA: YbhN family protein [Streptosporangiaceae bacterium]